MSKLTEQTKSLIVAWAMPAILVLMYWGLWVMLGKPKATVAEELASLVTVVALAWTAVGINVVQDYRRYIKAKRDAELKAI